MTWQERLKNNTLTITTGDGEIYTPLWTDAKKNINFNAEGFDFIDVEGTFVDRKKGSGAQFPITLIFQGENCIDDAETFLNSAKDVRPWTMLHPFYGELKVQPLSFEQDNSNYNVSLLTGTLWETIENKFPSQNTVPKTVVKVAKTTIDATVTVTFTNNIATPVPTSIEPSKDSALQTNSKYEKLTNLKEDSARLKNLVNEAVGASLDLISDATSYMQKAINLINYPFTIIQDIEIKVARMVEVAESLADIFIKKDGTLITGDDSVKNKQLQLLYESQTTVVISELSRNLVDSEYNTRAEVVNSIDSLSNLYDDYLNNLDAIGYDNDKQLSKEIDFIVNTSLASLYDIAFNAKQERFFILDKDDNIVTLAHRFYGTGDENIQLFIDQNSISRSEYLGLKKGRVIVYYV